MLDILPQLRGIMKEAETCQMIKSMLLFLHKLLITKYGQKKKRPADQSAAAGKDREKEKLKKEKRGSSDHQAALQ